MATLQHAAADFVRAFLRLGPLVDVVVLVALVGWLAYRAVSRIAHTIEYEARRRPLLVAWLLSRWFRR